MFSSQYLTRFKMILILPICLVAFAGCESDLNRRVRLASEAINRAEIEHDYLEFNDRLHVRHFNWSPMQAERQLEYAYQQSMDVTMGDFNAVEKMKAFDRANANFMLSKATIQEELELQNTPRAIAFTKEYNESEIVQKYLEQNAAN